MCLMIQNIDPIKTKFILIVFTTLENYYIFRKEILQPDCSNDTAEIGNENNYFIINYWLHWVEQESL